MSSVQSLSIACPFQQRLRHCLLPTVATAEAQIWLVVRHRALPLRYDSPRHALACKRTQSILACSARLQISLKTVQHHCCAEWCDHVHGSVSAVLKSCKAVAATRVRYIAACRVVGGNEVLILGVVAAEATGHNR
jgi:hypothetical protein